MEQMVTVYLLGKEYSVPATLTIMDAMEYAGFKLVRGCGCRSGFCGACAVIYRIKGSTELKVVLSCQTKVEEGMCVGKIDSFPVNKRTFNIEEIKATDNIVGQLYPEIFSCIGCNACTKGCPQGLDVMQYIAPKCEHLAERVAEIENGDYVTLLEKLKNTPLDELKDMYNKREIEK